eukprot:CAMPEP_0172915624 /NCGR_PEP_ID=MMETSP1075-20121228/194658_1 /TAXON_ID=2916 /ORGANISM="Ceratium fusus, Strain PA161109" /LENGTH=31 /DNA_ID= /DNA_START= /DNA_END= /DNA_ORIENTATION=
MGFYPDPGYTEKWKLAPRAPRDCEASNTPRP